MLLQVSLLPPALLDLTLTRAGTSNVAKHSVRGIQFSHVRSMYQASVECPPTPPMPYNKALSKVVRQMDGLHSERRPRMMQGGLMVRPGQGMTDTLTELDKRVRALEEAVDAEASSLDIPNFTEEELMSLYEDVLSITPLKQSEKMDLESDTGVKVEVDIAVIKRVDKRLLRGQNSTASTSQYPRSKPSSRLSQLYRRVLYRSNQIVSRIEEVRSSLNASSSTLDQDIPITVLSLAECESLIRVCIQAQDEDAAELALGIMKRSGMELSQDAVTDVLKLFAEKGHVRGVEGVMEKYLTASPTEQQRHLHVKAHIKATPPDTVPTSALSVLHSYESQSHPAPMRTYSFLITSLFSTKSSLGRAQGWDLFSHMRYVAHSDPDVPLYTTMIRACASPISSSRSSEPERALDLWTEMTVDRRLSPTLGAYNAIILACARSGSKAYVNEAFRLAKQMLDSHRDARGNSAFTPDRGTFCALLEGAKRIGDLARARWILAEMVKGRRGDTVKQDSVDEEIMMHVFHSYAAYRPPFKRTLANQKTEEENQQTSSLQLSSSQETSNNPTRDISEAPTAPSASFTHIPPQSRSEIVHEVKSLFERILQDTGRIPDPESESEGIFPSEKRFRSVELTSRLLNSYLSVHYKHSSLETSRDLYLSLFKAYDVPRTARTYVEALERCAIARRGQERNVAEAFAGEIWAQWQSLEDVGEEAGRLLNERMIERAHIAYIRVLTLVDKADLAVQHVKAFAERYPPSDIRTPAPKPALRSTRTVLVGDRPLVRMTSTVEVPDDHVPPLLMFNDLEALHHRLVAKGAVKDIGYLTYLCKAYEWALRARRDAALKATPQKVDNTPATV